MKVVATTRTEQGSGASRRLRRAGKVPGIVYGTPGLPVMIEIDHNPLFHSLKVESFHSSILDLEIDGKVEQVLLRDFNMHAFKQQVMHIDFQRVDATHKIHVKVPLHFKGQENSPAVKLSHGMVSHVMTELDVECLPGQLPEFIEVDLNNLEVGHAIHVSHLNLPAGVTPVLHGAADPVIVTVTVKGGGTEGTPAA